MPGDATIDGINYELHDRQLTADGRTVAVVNDAPRITGPLPLHVGKNGRLYAFPGTGDVLEIEVTADSADTTRHEALLPVRPVRLVWTDPAGRICVAFNNDVVAVLWPDGLVPPEIRKLMPVGRRSAPGPQGF